MRSITALRWYFVNKNIRSPLVTSHYFERIIFVSQNYELLPFYMQWTLCNSMENRDCNFFYEISWTLRKWDVCFSHACWRKRLFIIIVKSYVVIMWYKRTERRNMPNTVHSNKSDYWCWLSKTTNYLHHKLHVGNFSNIRLISTQKLVNPVE